MDTTISPIISESRVSGQDLEANSSDGTGVTDNDELSSQTIREINLSEARRLVKRYIRELAGPTYETYESTRRTEYAKNILSNTSITSEHLSDAESALEALGAKSKSLRELLRFNTIQLAISEMFDNVIKTTMVNGLSIYAERIKNMAIQGDESFEVDYQHLIDSDNELASCLLNVPDVVLSIFHDRAYCITLSLYKNYHRISPAVHVKITNLNNNVELRSINPSNINRLIRTTGIVNSSTSTRPRFKLIKYDCLRCNNVFGPFTNSDRMKNQKMVCPNCDTYGPFKVNTGQTTFEDYQRVNIHDLTSNVEVGRVRGSIDVILLGHLCRSCAPGDEIDVTGIYTVNEDYGLSGFTGFPVLPGVIIANNIIKKNITFSQNLTKKELKEIEQLSIKPRIIQHIIESICPSIYGHQEAKRAIALSLFGGCRKENTPGHKLRGDINVLLCGDPGTAKSQFLKYISQVSPKAIYTTGQGSSGVGLTAHVRRTNSSREWCLEAGALVLADGGVCLIDEFDKMSDQDRTSIHEAMEQQSISVSKAGIVSSLRAQCSVVAACNPKLTYYNKSLTFGKNVDLTEPILSRFDIICIFSDHIDSKIDSELVQFITRSDVRHHPFVTESEIAELNNLMDTNVQPREVISQDILKRYILYARNKCIPTIAEKYKSEIAKVYCLLREESTRTNSIPITPRHIESIIRCAESFARMQLKNRVQHDHVRLAITTVVESFISTQVSHVRNGMRKKFRDYIKPI